MRAAGTHTVGAAPLALRSPVKLGVKADEVVGTGAGVAQNNFPALLAHLTVILVICLIAVNFLLPGHCRTAQDCHIPQSRQREQKKEERDSGEDRRFEYLKQERQQRNRAHREAHTRGHPHPSSSSFLADLASASWHGQGHQAGLRHYGRYHCPGLTPQPLVQGPPHSEKHTARTPAAMRDGGGILDHPTPPSFPHSLGLGSSPWHPVLGTRAGLLTEPAFFLLPPSSPSLIFSGAIFFPRSFLRPSGTRGLLFRLLWPGPEREYGGGEKIHGP